MMLRPIVGPPTPEQIQKSKDSGAPDWEGYTLRDPAYLPEYCRTPVNGNHSFVLFMREHASSELKRYVNNCMDWARDNPGEWRPPWIDYVRAQKRLFAQKQKG